MYKIVQHPTFENQFSIIKNDTTWIAPHEDNPEYLMYLEWVAQGNTAEVWSPNDN
jgi:hypothetical protein